MQGDGVEIELPCGRYYLTGIGGLGGITLRITGHTVVFVDGDVNAVGALSVEMAPGRTTLLNRGTEEITVKVAGQTASLAPSESLVVPLNSSL